MGGFGKTTSGEKKRSRSQNKNMTPKRAKLVLEDGSEYPGWAFGRLKSIAGEVVINTGMNGLVQSLTDPGFHGQIIVSTYPLAGNCGVPVNKKGMPFFDKQGIPVSLESEQIHVRGLVVSGLCEKTSHYSSGLTLSKWFEKSGIPGIYGVDTRAVAIRFRERGAMRGKIITEGRSEVTLNSCILSNPFNVSHNTIKTFTPDGENIQGRIKIALIDCGVKANIIRCLLSRGAEVIRLPCDHSLEGIEYDGLLISSGPGDPKDCGKTIETVRRAFEASKPIFGIGLGNLIMALAAGADTYRLLSGHCAQNLPCIETQRIESVPLNSTEEGIPENPRRCYVTSQNHGYSIRNGTLPENWRSWFINANDGAMEGIYCLNKPFSAVLFNPEGCPGSGDTEFLFDRFIARIKEAK
ncbi:MAG: glutamine-hydrolyzing carbamoyl-phosphate synthase small subunit [Treponema sp.]|nr:glutamine-hydrolyzing carbamoyl-phosphate synthase small subunit [Treponema sp.]